MHKWRIGFVGRRAHLFAPAHATFPERRLGDLLTVASSLKTTVHGHHKLLGLSRPRWHKSHHSYGPTASVSSHKHPKLSLGEATLALEHEAPERLRMSSLGGEEDLSEAALDAQLRELRDVSEGPRLEHYTVSRQHIG